MPDKSSQNTKNPQPKINGIYKKSIATITLTGEMLNIFLPI